MIRDGDSALRKEEENEGGDVEMIPSKASTTASPKHFLGEEGSQRVWEIFLLGLSVLFSFLLDLRAQNDIDTLQADVNKLGTQIGQLQLDLLEAQFQLDQLEEDIQNIEEDVDPLVSCPVLSCPVLFRAVLSCFGVSCFWMSFPPLTFSYVPPPTLSSYFKNAFPPCSSHPRRRGGDIGNLYYRNREDSPGEPVSVSLASGLDLGWILSAGELATSR